MLRDRKQRAVPFSRGPRAAPDIFTGLPRWSERESYSLSGTFRSYLACSSWARMWHWWTPCLRGKPPAVKSLPCSVHAQAGRKREGGNERAHPGIWQDTGSLGSRGKAAFPAPRTTPLPIQWRKAGSSVRSHLPTQSFFFFQCNLDSLFLRTC